MRTPHCCSTISGFTLLLNVKLIFLLAPAVSLPSFPATGRPGSRKPGLQQPPSSALGIEEAGVAGMVSANRASPTAEEKQPVNVVTSLDGPKLWLWRALGFGLQFGQLTQSRSGTSKFPSTCSQAENYQSRRKNDPQGQAPADSKCICYEGLWGPISKPSPPSPIH